MTTQLAQTSPRRGAIDPPEPPGVDQRRADPTSALHANDCPCHDCTRIQQDELDHHFDYLAGVL